MDKIFQLFYQFRCVRFEHLSFINYILIETWIGNSLFDQISSCNCNFITTDLIMIDETMVMVTTIIEIEIMDKDPVIIMTVTIETIVRTTEIVIKIFIIDLNMDNLVTEIMEVLVIIDNLMKGMLYLFLQHVLITWVEMGILHRWNGSFI